MSEQTTFEDGDVRITTSRAVLGRDTFAMAQVSSVRVEVVPPNRLPALLLMLASLVLGMCCGLGDLGLIVGPVALLVFVGSLVAAMMMKTRYAVLLGTSGGERRGLVTDDRGHADAVQQAVEEALVLRG